MKHDDSITAYPLAWPDGRHPDVDGGSVELFVELQVARDDAVRSLGG